MTSSGPTQHEDDDLDQTERRKYENKGRLDLYEMRFGFVQSTGPSSGTADELEYQLDNSPSNEPTLRYCRLAARVIETSSLKNEYYRLRLDIELIAT